MDQISGKSSQYQPMVQYGKGCVEKSLYDPSKQFMVFVDFSKFHSDDSVGAKRLMCASCI